MKDKTLPDKEIIKALEECIELKFDDAEYATVRLDTLTNSLDLITRQQVKNENLKVENQSLRSAANSLKMHYEEAQAEVERLKKIEIKIDDFCRRLCRMRMLNGSAIASYEDLQNYIQEEKAKAYKEFAETVIDRVEKAKTKYQRLCKEQGEEMEEHMHIHFNGIIGIINNLVKEMVSEDNA